MEVDSLMWAVVSSLIFASSHSSVFCQDITNNKRGRLQAGWRRARTSYLMFVCVWERAAKVHNPLKMNNMTFHTFYTAKIFLNVIESHISPEIYSMVKIHFCCLHWKAIEKPEVQLWSLTFGLDYFQITLWYFCEIDHFWRLIALVLGTLKKMFQHW